MKKKINNARCSICGERTVTHKNTKIFSYSFQYLCDKCYTVVLKGDRETLELYIRKFKGYPPQAF
ncbi:MAG: hypothetical protein N3E48_03030 [Candidatus Bathyarchaeota archaeon]|nr:hypothetical protein [Candidatus Bathyarchaeota archaeon]